MKTKPYFRAGLKNWLSPNFDFRFGAIKHEYGEFVLHFSLCIWKYEINMGLEVENA